MTYQARHRQAAGLAVGRVGRWAGAGLALLGLVCWAAASAAVSPPNEKRQQPIESFEEETPQQGDRGIEEFVEETKPDQAADGRPRAALGVLVAPAPGQGVLVASVVPDGAGDQAGIRAGDFLLAVNDRDLASPAQLQKLIRSRQPGDVVSVKVWRNGEERTVDITLGRRVASGELRPEEEEEPLKRQAWLGVLLMPAEEGGVTVAQLYKGSPADDAGLNAGDRIMRIDDQNVAEAADVARRVESLAPGKKVQLEIVRDGERQKVAVELGNLADFHERTLGDRFRRRFDDFHNLFDPDFDGIPELGLWRDTDRPLAERERNLRSRIRDLLRELEDLSREREQQGQEDARPRPEQRRQDQQRQSL